MLPAAILASFLTGCATGPESAPAHPRIAIGRDCEALAANVPDPEISQSTNPWLGTALFAEKLDEANGNLTATRKCQAGQRERLAKGR